MLPAAAIAVLAGCSAGEPPVRPDVVLIVVDTLRRDHLGCYGHDQDTSPVLDRLAASSIRYTNAQSTAPWTLPAVTSILTGRDAGPLGFNQDAKILTEDLVLLPEVLQAAGYRTGAVVSQTFVSERWGMNQGFDSFDDSQVQGPAAITSPAVIDRALSFLQATPSETRPPTFLFVHLFDPHFAYIEHDGFRFEGPAYQGDVTSGTPFRELNQRQVAGTLTAADVAEMARLYASDVAFTDNQIGRLLDAVDDDTVVIVTADHGEGFLEHGHIGHGKTLHEEQIGVPLIVRVPGQRPAVRDEPVSPLDIFPTITALTGADAPSQLEGHDLLTPDPDRLVFASTERLSGSRAVRDDRYKLIQSGRGEVELYDLDADPGEQTRLSEVPPALRSALDAYIARFPERPAPAGRIAPEDRARLKALGYLEGD